MKKPWLRLFSLTLLLALSIAVCAGCQKKDTDEFEKRPLDSSDIVSPFTFSKDISAENFSLEFCFDTALNVRGGVKLYEGTPCEDLFFTKTTIIAKMEYDGKVYEQQVYLLRRLEITADVTTSSPVMTENMVYMIPASETVALSKYLQNFAEGIVDETETTQPKKNLYYFSDAIEKLVARIYPYTVSNYTDFVAEYKKVITDDAIRGMLLDLETLYPDGVVLGTDLLPILPPESDPEQIPVQ